MERLDIYKDLFKEGENDHNIYTAYHNASNVGTNRFYPLIGFGLSDHSWSLVTKGSTKFSGM